MPPLLVPQYTSPDGRRRYVHPAFDLAWPSLCRLSSLPNREVKTYARSRLTLIGDHYIGTARPVAGRPSYLSRPSFPLSVLSSSPSPLQLVCQSTSSLCAPRRHCYLPAPRLPRRRRHFRLPVQRLPRFRLLGGGAGTLYPRPPPCSLCNIISSRTRTSSCPRLLPDIPGRQ